MFPGVNGFHWSAMHIAFLSAFGLVLTTLMVTLAVAAYRTASNLRTGRAAAIAWHADFEDLPSQERRCRHSFDGVAPGRICQSGFDCRQCATHPKLAALRNPDDSGARLFHRGHTWVAPQPDGTVLVGIDELGARILGNPDRIELPPPGTKLCLNSPALTIERGATRVDVRSPLDGEVVENGGPGCEWLLRVKPAPHPAPYLHLLSGAEAEAWMQSETDRLLLLLSGTPVGAALADGGVLAPDLPKAMPDAPWEEASAAMFLNL